MYKSLTRFLNPRSSLGVSESALPMTGMTLTRGDKRRINSMSISLKLLYNSELSILCGAACYVRMSCGRDKVEQSVDSVVTEARVTFNARFFGQNVVVLAFKVTNDFLEAKLNVLEERCQENEGTLTRTHCQCCRQSQGCQRWLERYERRPPRVLQNRFDGKEAQVCDQHTNVGRFDSDALLDVGSVRVIRDFVSKDLGLAKGVHKSCTTGSRSTWGR